MPVYFIHSHSIQGKTVSLTGDLVHHFSDVLRCRPGETFCLVDENQTAYTVTINQVMPTQIIADIIETTPGEPVPRGSVILAQAMIKGKKMDWVIQKGTELGMNTLIPVKTHRSIPQPRPDRESHQLTRWKKIAREAAQQCGRRDIPDIRPPIALSKLYESGLEDALRLVFWEKETSQSLKSVLRNRPPEKTCVVLIGPEGGFSDHEIAEIKSGGWTAVSLGKRILRAETAGMAVLSVIQYEWDEPALGDRSVPSMKNYPKHVSCEKTK